MPSTNAKSSSFRTLVNGFASISHQDDEDSKDLGLRWYCAPDSWTVEDKDRREGRDGSWSVEPNGELLVRPPAKKDFWRRTYYDPLLVKDDGPALFATIPSDQAVTATTCFSIEAKRQFDQAGIYVRLDSEHWIKSGIEVVDEKPRLSCVCTNVYSDWSTQNYSRGTASHIKIRVHWLPHRGVVVEVWDDETSLWNFIRICHLSCDAKCDPDPLQDHKAVVDSWTGAAAPPGHVNIGIFACCPEDQMGTTVTFHSFSMIAGSCFKHDADGNFE